MIRKSVISETRAVREWSEGESQRWMGSRQLATYADMHKGLAEFLTFEGIIVFKGKCFFVQSNGAKNKLTLGYCKRQTKDRF